MPRIVTRKQWGAVAPKNVTRIEPVGGLAVHYSAMNADEQARHANCGARVLGIQRYHMQTKGWADIAYSFIVCKHGYIFACRGWGVRSAAQGTNFGNDHFHAVCFLGDDTPNRDDITALGRRALTAVLFESLQRYPAADILKPHSDFTQTSCPGDEIRAFLVTLRKQYGLARSG